MKLRSACWNLKDGMYNCEIELSSINKSKIDNLRVSFLEKYYQAFYTYHLMVYMASKNIPESYQVLISIIEKNWQSQFGDYNDWNNNHFYVKQLQDCLLDFMLMCLAEIDQNICQDQL